MRGGDDGDGAGRMLGGMGGMRGSASGGAAGAGQDGGRMQERGGRGMPGRRGASRGCWGGRRQATETPDPPHPCSPVGLLPAAGHRGGRRERAAGKLPLFRREAAPGAAPPRERGRAVHDPRSGYGSERDTFTNTQILLIYWTLQRERRGRFMSILGAAPHAARESEKGRCQLPTLQLALWDLPLRCWQSCL